MSSALPTSGQRTARLVPAAVLVLLVSLSLVAFIGTRNLVDDQERRLLEERGDEVSAILSTSFQSIESSLRILAGVGSSTDPAAVALFEDSANQLITESTVAVAVAVAAEGGFTVIAGVGERVSSGTTLTGPRDQLLARALDEGQLVSLLLHEGDDTRLLFAVPAVGSSQVVAFQEARLTPGTPIPPAPDSPFRELRVALYASVDNDPAALVLTTEARVPLTGEVDRDPFPVGADEWLVAVGARQPLVGSFAERAPWFLLAGGLLASLLAAAVAHTLARRRSYALGLVAERTGQLAEIRAFLERLLTAGPTLVKRISVPERQITYVSPNVEHVIGVTEEQALSPGFLGSQIHVEDRHGFDSALDRIADGSSSREVNEHRIDRGDGEFRWVSAVLVPETDADGHTTAVLGYVNDVDDRHRAEEAQRRAQQGAETANRSKSEFLSRMSHELRTPLNAVLGFAQLLELEEISEDQRDSVGQILKGGRHLLDLINEVLDISRIEAGELALSPEPVLSSELIQEAVDLIRPLAGHRGIQLVVDRSGVCDCYLYADHQRVKQVLLNLLSNAVKYNRLGGTVAVTCAQPTETRIRVTVTDTGPGIPAERLGQLFIPFDRLGAEHSDVEGTGIGLALSQRLATAMGGTLTATSSLGQGSTFSLELPRVEGPVERFERLNGDRDTVTTTGLKQHKVLHIEDNLANLRLVERVLAMRDDIEVVPAMHGGLGLELARDHNPVLVLLDVHLPDMGGEEVLQRLRDDPATASIPVVIVSADATPGQLRRLLAAGATDYLTKPIDVRELLRVLDDATSRPHRHA